MQRRAGLACATLVGAVLAGGVASAGGGAGERAAAKGVWVGTLKLAYQRDFDLPRPNDAVATERDSRRVTITNRRDGTAVASVRVRSRNTYPCSDGGAAQRIEEWDLLQKVSPMRVTFTQNRYQITYTTPSKEVRVHVSSCTSSTDRLVIARAMNVGFQLYGRARPDAKRITGSWRQTPACTGNCLSYGWDAQWDLTFVPASDAGSSGGGGGSGGGGSGSGGGPGSAGAGCEARPRQGTPADDVLTGTASAELFDGLGGNDRIDARGGSDCLRGGAGDDTLLGGHGNDLLVGAAGSDLFDGGAGNDELRARDGVAEQVRCGSGRDLAVVDSADTTSGCETTRR